MSVVRGASGRLTLVTSGRHFFELSPNHVCAPALLQPRPLRRDKRLAEFELQHFADWVAGHGFDALEAGVGRPCSALCSMKYG
jgi:hypothetical protein